jgi:hypothetical protein
MGGLISAAEALLAKNMVAPKITVTMGTMLSVVAW